MKKNKIFFISCFIFLLSLFYRYGNLSTPFWVDEFSSANQASLFLKHGFNLLSQNEDFLEHNNFFTHFLISASFRLGETNEYFARLPFVIIGSMVPVLMFWLVLKLFGLTPALCSSFLLIFSYWQITWSRQARGYVLQQFLLLLSLLIYNYFLILKNGWKKFLMGFCFLLTLFIGLLTHKLFIFVAFSFFLHFFIFHFNEAKKIIKKYWWLCLFFILGLIIIELRTNTFASVLRGLRTGFLSFYNNTWYYQRFLWKHYSLIVFLALIGFFIGLKKNKSITSLFFLIIVFIFSFINFFFFAFASKYLLPIFPFLLIFAGLAINEIAFFLVQLIKQGKKNKKTMNLLVGLGLVGFIIINGDQFSLKKKIFYSVNYNFREIALIDYDEVYNLIKSKIDSTDEKVVMIDTWIDRSRWYLGREYFPLGIFRNIDGSDPYKKTPYQLNSKNQKIIIRNKKNNLEDEKNIILIGELNDLTMIINQYKKGFLLVDDDTMSREVISYAQDNLKLELFTDHFELDENPYSKWPLYLYSWGFDD